MTQLMFDKELGSGSFGTVYKGHWRQWTVAIKQLKNLCPQDSKEYQEFIGEAELMTKVRPHENVVRFVGVTKPPNLCIVLEFVPRGALYDYLQSPAMIGGDVMLNILRGTAAGMAHLHTEKVVHRDLAARNVLLDQNLTAKIADMGMSRVIQNTSGQGAQQTKSDTGPLKWMAPESIKNREYSYKSDVWSFGVVITEVLTRCSEPYPDLEPIQVATRVAYEDLRPPVPPGASQTVQNVLRACSERQPENRPTMQEIVGFFSWERSVFA
jgi:serine/threonine protein kinase